MLTFMEETHQYAWNGESIDFSVTQVLEKMGCYNGADFFTPEGAMRGRFVHLACEFYDKGTLDESTIDPVIVPYLESWKLFRQTTHFEPMMIETLLYSEVYRIAGRLDRFGKFNDDQYVLIDIKTGTPQACDCLQLAMYEVMLREQHQRAHVTHYSPLPAILRGSVYLQSDGKLARWIPYNNRHDKDIYLALLTAARWKKQEGLL